jgi:uncharacterized cofD-like protein
MVMEQDLKQAKANGWQAHLRWLKPGLGLKRWLLLLALGVGLLSVGGAFALRSFYPLPSYFYYLTLQFLPAPLRAIALMLVGVGLIGLSLAGLNRTLLAPFVGHEHSDVPEKLFDYRRRGRGPRVVVLGGGHGQSSILRGLKSYTSNLTAIVTVADDGGSSGRLRRDLGILPPGDFRNCIAALSNDESLVTRLFQYRFTQGAGLNGHSFGNLFISAMATVTGSFEAGLKESSQVLAVQGHVIPCTLQAVTLVADVREADGTSTRVWGESQIPKASRCIMRVGLEPDHPPAYPGALRAILNADMIVVGPGSLYTSILPNLLVPEIVQAIRTVNVPKVYICNVATQVGETDDYTVEDHLKALEVHLGPGFFSAIVINTYFPPTVLPENVDWVPPTLKERPGLRVLRGNLVHPAYPWRHDSAKLAEVVQTLLR